MTIHPYLEDEIDVLVDLLAELARFHEVLHTLDLKACMNVWNFYSKFATDYFDHMKYDFFFIVGITYKGGSGGGCATF